MSVLLSSSVLWLILLAGGTTTVQPLSSRNEMTGVGRVIELPVETPQEVPELRVGLGVITILEFASPLMPGGIEVEDQELLSGVGRTDDQVLLAPSPTWSPGSRTRLKVRFVEGSHPASADFFLVLDTSRADHRVQVRLQPFMPELSWQQVEAERAKTRQCQAELTQVLQMPDGLTGLIARKQLDVRGLMGQTLNVRKELAQRPMAPLQVKFARSYRAHRVVAVELWVLNVSTRPWTVKGAELVGPGGARLKVLRVWPSQPLPPGNDRQRVIIEAEAGEQDDLGSFTLTLWQEGEAPSVSVGGVVFPKLPQARADASR